MYKLEIYNQGREAFKQKDVFKNPDTLNPYVFKDCYTYNYYNWRNWNDGWELERNKSLKQNPELKDIKNKLIKFLKKNNLELDDLMFIGDTFSFEVTLNEDKDEI